MRGKRYLFHVFLKNHARKLSFKVECAIRFRRSLPMHSRAPENEVRPAGGTFRPYEGRLFFFHIFFVKLFVTRPAFGEAILETGAHYTSTCFFPSLTFRFCR